jgi:hypothetical protein
MKINSYLISDNSNNLLGTENDIKLIYNLFNSFFKNNSNSVYLKWDKPNIFLNNFLIKVIKNNTSNDNKIIIYFSGHSNKRGELFINNKKFKCIDFLNFINNLKLNNINVLFIIDSCYSEKFIENLKFKYINKIEYLVSCQKNQTSKEILVEYNNKKVVHGIFTFYLYKILKKNNGIINIENIINNPIFKYIDKKFNQKIIYQCI